MQRPCGRREQADIVGSEMQPCVVEEQSMRGEMDQADAVVSHGPSWAGSCRPCWGL